MTSRLKETFANEHPKEKLLKCTQHAEVPCNAEFELYL
jgi:hypothetical protein